MKKNTANTLDFSKTQKSSSVLNQPNYTVLEEILNSVAHGFGVVFSIFALIILITKYPKVFSNIFCLSVYGTTLLTLYTVSTLYHALKPSATKCVFRKLDHCSIFLLIAGTYTPLCLMFIKEPTALAVLGAVWVLALIGIVLNSIDVNKFSKISLACYLGMGWSVVFMYEPTIRKLSTTQLNFLVIGGIFYTVGALLYVLGKKIRYMHCVWHVFVLAGSVFHFLIVYAG